MIRQMPASTRRLGHQLGSSSLRGVCDRAEHNLIPANRRGDLQASAQRRMCACSGAWGAAELLGGSYHRERTLYVCAHLSTQGIMSRAWRLNRNNEVGPPRTCRLPRPSPGATILALGWWRFEFVQQTGHGPLGGKLKLRVGAMCAYGHNARGATYARPMGTQRNS